MRAERGPAEAVSTAFHRENAMHRWPFRLGAANALGWVAAALLALSPRGAIAAPKRLDCNLTALETRAGLKLENETEDRPIVVVFDDVTKTLTVYQNGAAQTLNNVFLSQTSISGYDSEISLGLEPWSLGVVLQTYKREAVIAEFGKCISPKSPP